MTTERAEFAERVALLSPRCRDVLALLGEAMRNKEIARSLPKQAGEEGEHVAESTVKGYVEDVIHGLGVANRQEAGLLLQKYANE